MVAEVSGVATWKTLAVDLHEGLGCELPVGAVGYEALVPLLQVHLDSVQEEPEPSTWIVSSSYLVLAFKNSTSSLVSLPALELPCLIMFFLKVTDETQSPFSLLYLSVSEKGFSSIFNEVSFPWCFWCGI